MRGLRANVTRVLLSCAAARRLARLIPIDSTKPPVIDQTRWPLCGPAGAPLPKFFKPGGDRYVNMPRPKSSSAFAIAPRPASATTVVDAPRCIAVDVFSSNVEPTPGEVAVFNFRVSNSAPEEIWVELTADNSLVEWTANIGENLGAGGSSTRTMAPAHGIVIVPGRVVLPIVAPAEDRDRTSLSAKQTTTPEPVLSRMAG